MKAAPRVIYGPIYGKRHATTELPAVTVRLPEMERSATFKREEIDTEKRIVPVTFATEAEIGRWFGREKLLCSSQNVRTDRANNLGAFLSEHDRNKQIGVIVPASVSFTADRKGVSQLRFSKNPLAEQEWNDLKDEIRGLFSVGYVIHRMVLREEDDEKGNLYEADDWEILEISMVSIPADPSCSVNGRASNDENALTFPACLTTDEKNRTTFFPMLRKHCYFARFFHEPPNGQGHGASPGGSGTGGEQNRGTGNNPGGGSPGTGNTPDPKGESERVIELGSIAARFNVVDKLEKWIRDGTTVADVWRFLAENGKTATPAGNPGNGNGSGQARALLTGGGEGGQSGQMQPVGNLTRSVGQLLVDLPAYKEWIAERQEGNRSNRSFHLPEANIRATLTTGALTVTQRLPGVDILEQQRLTVADLIAPGTTNGTTIEFLQETVYANAAAAVAEGGTKPEATFTLELKTSSVRKIAVTAKVTDEMLADFAYIASFMDARLRFMVDEREEALLLSGDGVAPNLLGITQTPGIQTQAMGADTAVDAILRGITKVRVTGKAEPTAIIIHPNDWEDIRLSKDANGQYLAGGPFYVAYGQGTYANVERIWGLPVVVTVAMTENTALVGAFRTQAQIFRRTGVTVEATNSNEDDFKKNLVALRAEERLALVVYRPAAFCTVTGI